MEIQEIRSLKDKLEMDLLRFVADFERATDVTVTKVELEHKTQLGKMPKTYGLAAIVNL